MPLEDLPDGFTVPTRNEVRDNFQRNVAVRQPGAPIGEGSQAFVDGSVIADILTPLYADAASIGRAANIDDMTREQLKAECRALGIVEELPESSSTGFVKISASAGGVFVDTNRLLKDSIRNLTFKCATADTYYDGKALPVISVDTGAQTNIPAATTMTWVNPPAGLGYLATVLPDTDSSGLTGGRAAESDDDIRDRVKSARQEGAAGGNVATIRKFVAEAGKNLGIAVQDSFVYPCITGSGHYAYCFLLRPGDVGASRIPDAVAVAQVRDYLTKALPEDDGIFAAVVIEQKITMKLRVKWASAAVGWVDAQPWPRSTDSWKVTTATDATHFIVTSSLGAAALAPQVGQTMAFYNRASGTFARKRILTATVGAPGVYTIVVDDANNASDIAFPPAVNDEPCPYSTSLDLLVKPLRSQLDLKGPGEQADMFFDEGYRQRRWPPDPAEWPMAIRHNDLGVVDDLPQILDVDWLAPPIPYSPNPGVPGASSNLIVADAILAFAS